MPDSSSFNAQDSPRRKTPKSATGREDEKFSQEAAAILRSALVRKKVSHKELARLLGDVDGESPKVLSNKISRGLFSFAFFIRVMRAIELHRVDIGPAE